MEQKYDLTEGNIIRTVLFFSLPFLGANLIQALYGAVDLMIIGWYCPPEAIAAVSTGSQVTQIVTCMISGLTLGATVTVGKYAGRKEPEEVKRNLETLESVWNNYQVYLNDEINFIEEEPMLHYPLMKKEGMDL